MEHLHKVLIDRAKLGETEAVNKIYSLYSKAMLNTSYRIVNNLEDAEDVLQESFLKAFSKMDQFQYRSTFGAWIKRIVVNKSIDCIKKRQKNGFVVALNEEKQFEENCNCYLFETEKIDHNEKINRVYDALHQLPTGYRTVFSLYLLEGYDHEEIAEILNISVSTSISQLCRAKKKIKLLTQQKSK